MKKTTLVSMVFVILMLMSACGNQKEATVVSTVSPSVMDTKSYISFTSKSGEKLYLGMSREDCEKTLGIEVEDGWLTIIPMPTEKNPNSALSITSFDGVIRAIGADTPEWGMDNSIGVGSGKDEAVKGLCEPERWNNSDTQRTVLIFTLADTYKITFTVGSQNEIMSFGASWLTDEDTNKNFGIRMLMGSGIGNAHIEGPKSPREYLDISHSGSGKFKVTVNTAYMENNKMNANSFVIIDRVGKYNGRVFCPSQHIVSYDVVADGEWAIWADMYILAAIFTNETSFKGTGDYATQYISPDAGGIGGTWKITHEGIGKYILKMNSLYISDFYGKAVILEVDGPYSGEIQVENVKPDGDENKNNTVPMAFEIITDGNWTIERVK